MIVLHKKENHKKSKRLEERLKDLVISFKTEVHEEHEHRLPFIEENERVFSTPEEIDNWLQELTSQLEWHRSLSGDGCFIDPETGKVC